MARETSATPGLTESTALVVYGSAREHTPKRDVSVNVPYPSPPSSGPRNVGASRFAALTSPSTPSRRGGRESQGLLISSNDGMDVDEPDHDLEIQVIKAPRESASESENGTPALVALTALALHLRRTQKPPFRAPSNLVSTSSTAGSSTIMKRRGKRALDGVDPIDSIEPANIITLDIDDYRGEDEENNNEDDDDLIVLDSSPPIKRPRPAADDSDVVSIDVEAFEQAIEARQALEYGKRARIARRALGEDKATAILEIRLNSPLTAFIKPKNGGQKTWAVAARELGLSGSEAGNVQLWDEYVCKRLREVVEGAMF